MSATDDATRAVIAAAPISRKPSLLQPGHPDNFQTPPSALAPLWDYIPSSARIWEPACGQGSLVAGFEARGHPVVGTDILTGSDFLTWEPAEWDVMVTNPPYSIKDQWIARCYELGKPFALLLPLTALEGQRRQALYRQHGLQVILMPRRVNFQTPNGKGSSAWFATAWFLGFWEFLGSWDTRLPSDLLFWQPPATQIEL